MYLVLYCHNIGMTDFSFFETDDFDKDEGYIVRGKWPNEKAFRAYLNTEFPDITQYQLLDLISQGQHAENYSQQELETLSQSL